MSAPYEAAAPELWSKGWRGVFPLPAGQKSPPPPGWTGAGAPWPSYADMAAWVEDAHGNGHNVGVRVPEGVIGLDVDAYGSKPGAATLAALVKRYGPLPTTYVVTSRGPQAWPSGIHLYRVPDGLAWPGELGPAVEIVQTRHRYFVAPPSLHPSGEPYAWWRNGLPVGTPDVYDLGELPDAWVEGITGGRLAVDLAKQAVSTPTALAWLKACATGAQCPAVVRATGNAIIDLGNATRSRHDTATRAAMHIVRLGQEGHIGAAEALAWVGDVFVSAVVGDGSRTEDAAAAEWRRLVDGAVGVATAAGPNVEGDPCADPWRGIIAPGAKLEIGKALAAPVTAQQAAPQLDGAPEAPEAATDPLEAVRAALVAEEVERQRARRQARRLLDIEEAAAGWREPPGWTLPDLLALPDEPIRYVVDRLMPDESNVLLTAQFKAGKTTCMLNLTRALADGKPFLGAFSTDPGTGRVALWNYEVSAVMFARWLRDAHIENPHNVVGLNLRGFTAPFIAPGVEDWAVAWLESRQVAHWVVDPWGRAISGANENDNAEVGKWTEALDRIKERAGVRNLIVPTHTGRSEQTQGAERARGATRLNDWCDVQWVLTVQEGSRFFRAHGRDVDVDEGALEYDPLMRSLTYVPGGRDPEPTRPARSGGRRSGERNIYDEIVVSVGLNPGMSATEVAKNIARRKGDVLAAVKALESQGKIAKRGERLYMPGLLGPVPG